MSRITRWGRYAFIWAFCWWLVNSRHPLRGLAVTVLILATAGFLLYIATLIAPKFP